MRKITVFFLILTCSYSRSQNLIPNGDFEGHNIPCITWFSNVSNWINPANNVTGGTPDYLNQCNPGFGHGVPSNFFGYQFANSGVAYCGFIVWNPSYTNYREYIEVPLSSPLINDECYYFEMYISVGKHHTTDDIGAYFSDTLITNIPNNLPLPFTPQFINQSGNYPDTVGWTLVSGHYIAHGGEQFVTIGNFKTDSMTNIVPLGATGGYCYFYIDDVSLTSCSTGINQFATDNNAYIYPNPSSDRINISVPNNQSTELILFDVSSRIILKQQLLIPTSLDIHQLANGIYIYEMRSKSGLCIKGKFIKE